MSLSPLRLLPVAMASVLLAGGLSAWASVIPSTSLLTQARTDPSSGPVTSRTQPARVPIICIHVDMAIMIVCWIFRLEDPPFGIQGQAKNVGSPGRIGLPSFPRERGGVRCSSLRGDQSGEGVKAKGWLDVCRCCEAKAEQKQVEPVKVVSMSTRLELVEVGAPPGRLSDWVIAPVRFNGFRGLTTTKGARVRSPNESSDGYVALFLQNVTEEAVKIEFNFIVKHPNGREDVSVGVDKVVKFSKGVGYDDFALRSTLLDYLVDGAMIVEVHMRTTNKPLHQSSSFVPENPFLRNALTDFGNEETADVKFEVGGTVESAMGRRKRAKTPKIIFHAHHIFLRLNAPTLADMCKPGDDSAPTTINNIQPATFKHLLYYCYGGKIGKDDLQSDAKDIIEAADRFGIVSLKLEAEACYVGTVELTLDNIVEIVTYADSKNLALLKEHCMDFLSSANKIEAAEKVSFDDMPSHLVKDLMVAFARREGEGSGNGDTLSTMRVSQLRKLAHKKGLSVDGSREMLIDAIRDGEQDGETES
ncbi:hypothetical protein THAOC_33785 [Thalassiosira oceanica]|uniref:SAP domain-containing protein n=1 Tax=Thalassiosira oceanica TaxID=159749 RepID=K0RLA4_THAOC|nr:hypothetical protein THAOC_33785 [Thalassiosira oceanica]|eukprot:EJK47487.1 hypothetical protein THAOC_33785 [Thalassiosira oceanica]